MVCAALLLGGAQARPASAYLGGLTHVAQSYNNCGPAAIVSVLGYYGTRADQAAVARALRPQGGYMRADVIAPFVAQYGLRAARFRAGNAEHLRRLVAAGVPVIVLQWLDRVGGIPHFRVVRGYDDARGVFYLDDPLYGANVVVSYAEFARLWGVYGQEFIPVFPAGWEARVDALLGFAS
ncbi:peptidase C39 bacteriocin processing [Deinococcus maricopensis DSM 21211]|uniref:Peptidase C39 bacteriocin processing n=1 Tax=Deinococcus maricopensis (strain DSM 21211 / LMG 22137 / NRRL B-23946 / LB-34) TaxID=709986 RepID=E8UB08_DEIML|nr:peptidase C39 bacteriocin processing [Deinococcus maricopensis DSM 21211]